MDTAYGYQQQQGWEALQNMAVNPSLTFLELNQTQNVLTFISSNPVNWLCTWLLCSSVRYTDMLTLQSILCKRAGNSSTEETI